MPELIVVSEYAGAERPYAVYTGTNAPRSSVRWTALIGVTSAVSVASVHPNAASLTRRRMGPVRSRFRRHRGDDAEHSGSDEPASARVYTVHGGVGSQWLLLEGQ